jgi:hypothetical protein
VAREEAGMTDIDLIDWTIQEAQRAAGYVAVGRPDYEGPDPISDGRQIQQSHAMDHHDYSK